MQLGISKRRTYVLKFIKNPVSTGNYYWNNPSEIYLKVGKPDTRLGGGWGGGCLQSSVRGYLPKETFKFSL